MRVIAGVATDIGKVRENNEDSYLVSAPLFAVADGMGGHKGGEVASHLALDTIESLVRGGEGDLADQVKRANSAVFERGSADRSVRGMGTTLTAALMEPDAVRLVHVGDSRAYLLRAGALRQLTQDHTLVGKMVSSGEITKAEAEVHPHRSVLTRALGIEPEVEVDETTVALLAGDRLLLCSDGLTAMVTEDQIQAIVEAAPDAQDAANRLVRAANRAGGIDNITVVVLDLAEGEGVSLPGARPVRRRRAVSARKLLVRSVVALTVAGALLAGFRFYLDRQWYVGASNGQVAVYQGIPATFAGWHFSHVVEETDLRAGEVEVLTLYGSLQEGITAGSREDAAAIVAQMRMDLAAAGGRTTDAAS